MRADEEHADGAGRPDDSGPFQPAGLRPNEEAYLASVERLVDRYSQDGRRRLRRYVLSTVAAMAFASAVPVAIAAGAPGWVAASLGGAAALTLGLQQLLQDQRLGTECHAMAVDLARAVRRLRYQADGLSADELRRWFRTFMAEVEEADHAHGSTMLDLMRQTGPRPDSPAPQRTSRNVAG
jgi:hypothetical protein